MPKVRRARLPEALFDHLIERADQRKIAFEDIVCSANGSIRSRSFQTADGINASKTSHFAAKENSSKPFFFPPKASPARKFTNQLHFPKPGSATSLRPPMEFKKEKNC
jgi:hypothetical protein